MQYLSINYLIFYAFLGITALVGSWGGKVRSSKEYIDTDKKLGTGALVMTLLATNITGTYILHHTNTVYSVGFPAIIRKVIFVNAATYLMVIYFIAPRIVHFKNCKTAGDLAAIFYGQKGRILMGLISIYFCCTLCARQIVWLQKVTILLDINSYWGLGVMVMLLGIYTARGGMKAVVATDILHFVIFIGIIPLMAHMLLYRAGGIRTILSALSPEQTNLFIRGSEPANFKSLTTTILMSIFPAFTLSFPFIQRLLMAKHQQQSTNMYKVGWALMSPFILVLSLIGLSGIVLHPEATKTPIFIRLVEEFPAGVQGLIWVSIAGVIISTIDSLLHIASISIVQDIIQPFADRWGIPFSKIKAYRYSALWVAFLGFLICLKYPEEVKKFSYIKLAGLLFLVPLVSGIMGLKTNFREFSVASITTLSFFFFAKIVLGDLDMALTGGLIVSVFSFLGTHYYYNRAFVTVKRSAYGQTTSVWHPSWQGTKTAFINLIPTPQKFARYFQEKVKENSYKTNTLAIFVAVSYMVPLFMNAVGNPDAYNWLFAFRIVGAMLCVGLLLKSQWPVTLLRYFPAFYHLTLLWCFPFMTAFLFFLEGGSTEWSMNVVLSIMLFIVLLDYATAFLLSVLGIALAMGIYRLGIGPVALSTDPNTVYTLFYGVAFSIAIGMLFSRVREKLVKRNHRRLKDQEKFHKDTLVQVAAEKQAMLNTLHQAGAERLLSIAQKLNNISTAIEAKGQLQASPNESLPMDTQLQTLQAEFLPIATQLQNIQKDLFPVMMQMKDINARGQDYLRLHIQKDLPIDQFLLSLQEKLLPRGIDVPVLIERKTQHQNITADPEQLISLLIKGIASLQWLIQDEDQYLLLAFEDTHLSYSLPDVAEDYVKYVPALRITLTTTEQLPPLNANYKPDLTSSAHIDLQTFEEMEQRTDERIIKGHYGYAETKEDTLVYVIPVDLRAVRPQEMDKPYMDLNAIPQYSNDHFRNEAFDAQAQEKAFLDVVAARSKADLGLVRLAINVIKWYHGPKKRHSGEPFYLHPLAVAEIVLDYNTDEATILGALLHDTVEDTQMLLQHIGQLFGQETQEIVDTVTHLQSIEGSIYKIKLSAEENLKMLSRPGSERGLYVKLADRMHNMRTIEGHKKIEKRRLIAQETLNFFVPLAERLGLQEAAKELKEHCHSVGIRPLG